MLIRNYTLRFTTPAFLGNAEQTGQWRTPPFKALLRQWWRVAAWADQADGADRAGVNAMRAAEGALFGVAADTEGASRKSQIRIRLGRWDKGRTTPWNGADNARINHPEVKNREGLLAPVGPMLYLGYGPLEFAQGQTSFKAGPPIQADEFAPLSLAFRDDAEAARVDLALGLLHRFGTLGGRSRNGWGSFSLLPADAATPTLDGLLDERLTAPWQDALKLDWPHAIGRDLQGPLIWQTAPLADWKGVMRRLAEIKIALRTQKVFTLTTGKNAASPELRHWLSYPVTNHNVTSWKEREGKRDLRLPNSLRFKVRAEANGQLRGVIFHVPCKPPPQFKPDLQAISKVWQQVHNFLDQQPAHTLQRIAA